MGLFGHKKKMYVLWCRFNDSQDDYRVITNGFGTQEVSVTLKKLINKDVKPKDIRILNDLLVNTYTKPLTKAYVSDIITDAWKIVTSKYRDELFDKSDDVPLTAGSFDLSQIPGFERLGLFFVFIEA